MENIKIMNEINKLFNNFEKKFIARVNVQVKQAVEQNEDFITKSLININKQSASSTEPLDIKSLTQRLLRLEGQVIELKRTSKPYALGVQVRDMFHKFQKLSSDMNEIIRRQDVIDTETFLDTSISPEQLKKLYVSSNSTATELAKIMNIDKSRVYQIINGQEKNKDWVRINKMKRFFLKRIKDNAGT
tara:strand:+ start:6549 stop:7112 length:564 start_codon:yes stop_codon:yes gene_type:complete